MQRGGAVHTQVIPAATKEIVEKMLGRSFEESFPKEECNVGETIFETDNNLREDPRGSI